MLTCPQCPWCQPSVKGLQSRCPTPCRVEPRSRRSHPPPQSRFRVRQLQELRPYGAPGPFIQLANGHETGVSGPWECGEAEGQAGPRAAEICSSSFGPSRSWGKRSGAWRYALSTALPAGAVRAAIDQQHLPAGHLGPAPANLHEKAEPGVQGDTTPTHCGLRGPGLSSEVDLMAAAGPKLSGPPFHVLATWRKIRFRVGGSFWGRAPSRESRPCQGRHLPDAQVDQCSNFPLERRPG